MKIAVTGASGFIGRYVLAELVKYQDEVIAVTRHAAHLAGIDKAVRIVEMDIAASDESYYARLGKPDLLIHLAWDGLPHYNSLHHFEIELPRQYQFLKTMIKAGLQSLLVTGTCFEYGMQSGPLSEEVVTQPSNPYGYAKDALRRQLTFLASVAPFQLTWARLFYLYGDGQAKGSLYSQIKDAVMRGDRVFNMSGGEQLRDYSPIDKVAQYICHLAKCNDNHGCVNICSGKPISIRNLVEKWKTENSWDIALNLGHYPYPDYEPLAFWGNRERLDTLLETL